MQRARVTEFDHDGRVVTNVEISETGSYAIDAAMISSAICARALDVVRISVGNVAGELVLESKGDVVTTEMLTDDIRLQIQPKVGIVGLNWLLDLASGRVMRLAGEHVISDTSHNIGVYDLFVYRFLDAMVAVVRGGFIPGMPQCSIVSDRIDGVVRPVESYAEIYLRQHLAFLQTVSRMSHDVAANRVLKTTLIIIARSGLRLEESLIQNAKVLLQDMSDVRPFLNTREALVECEAILRSRCIDGSRSYYYAALESARPILKATSTVQVGNPAEQDIPIRIPMAATFEAAVRNATFHALGTGFRTRKESGRRMYATATPPDFGPVLEPDIVIAPTGAPRAVVAILDAKYKKRAAAGDHYQLAAYALSYHPKFCAFVTLVDQCDEEGARKMAAGAQGGRVYEYGLFAGDLPASFSRFAVWIASEVTSSIAEN